MSDIKFEVILGMFFLKISNANVSFSRKTLMRKSYITNKTLSTTEQVKIVDLKEFVIATCDTDSKTFVVHMAIREQKKLLWTLSKKLRLKLRAEPKAEKTQVKALIFVEALTKISVEYFNYNNVFLAENVAELLQNTRINEYAIKLEQDKQLPFGSIYNLGSVKLKTLKTYIEINLANSFICFSKSPTRALILFNRKPNGSLCFSVDY